MTLSVIKKKGKGKSKERDKERERISGVRDDSITFLRSHRNMR